MSTTTRITDKGQTTIPKELREKYGIDPGDTVVWEETEAGIVIRKVVNEVGRGIWLDEGWSAEDRETLAEALESEIRQRRDSEWAVE